MTDELIMQRVKEGDISQAAVLFQRYHRRIYLYLGKISGDYITAEDLTQNVFEKLLHYKTSFDPNQKFESWVFRIARNTFFDHVQAKTKMIKPLQMESAELNNIKEEAYENEVEQDAMLNRALGALHQEDREVLVLTRFEKMKYHEVASLLNTTESNVKVKVFRAIEKLRNHYFKIASI